MKKVQSVIVIFILLFINKNVNGQSVINSCRKDIRNGTLVAGGAQNVINTACDIWDNGTNTMGSRLEVYAMDGNNPGFTLIDPTGPKFQIFTPILNANDIDIVIGFDEPNLIYNIHVVYEMGTSIYYQGYDYKYTSHTLISKLPQNISGLANITNQCIKPNIDIDDRGQMVAITFEDATAQQIYGCATGNTLSFFPLVTTPYLIDNGIEPDVAVTEDFIYFSYLNPQRTALIVNELNFSQVIYSTGTGHSCVAYTTGKSLLNPRIAASTEYRLQGDWAVVMEDFDPSYSIVGVTGHSNVPNTTAIKYMQSSTWLNQPSPPYDLIPGYANKYPVVSFTTTHNFEMQIAWQTSDYLNGLRNAGNSTVVGLIADKYGNPIPVSNTCHTSSITHPVYEIVPYVVSANCPQSLMNKYFGYTGVGNLDYQSLPSVADKNSLKPDFMIAYYDEGVQVGCQNEMIYKDRYTSTNGFRMANNVKQFKSINSEESEQVLKLKINCLGGNLYLESTNENSILNTSITDLCGRVLFTITNKDIETTNYKMNFVTNNLPTGLYLLRAVDEKGNNVNGKFVKQ